MEKVKTLLYIILSTCALLGIAWGATSPLLDDRWNQSEDVQSLTMRFEQKVQTERLYYLEDRIRQLESQEQTPVIEQEILDKKREKKEVENSLSDLRKGIAK